MHWKTLCKPKAETYRKLAYDDFKKLGRLGCSECYSFFHENLSVLLKKIHGSNRHYGKSPKGFLAEAKGMAESLKVLDKPVDALLDLRNKLQHAIQCEDFEKAAEIRDNIRMLEQKDGNQ